MLLSIKYQQFISHLKKDCLKVDYWAENMQILIKINPMIKKMYVYYVCQLYARSFKSLPGFKVQLSLVMIIIKIKEVVAFL